MLSRVSDTWPMIFDLSRINVVNGRDATVDTLRTKRVRYFVAQRR